jgi:glycosyltransferase involved in cell wall biosynthesis
MNLSVIIIAKNEEGIIADCLKSVSFADEIIVIDDYSTDKTAAIAKKHGARVFLHKMKDFADQRNYGLKKALGTWKLCIDADERVTPQLRDEIVRIVMTMNVA